MWTGWGVLIILVYLSAHVIIQDEFTCYDGSCIAMSHRCDAISDCRDKSDEMNCATLSTNTGNFGTYLKTLAPVSDFSTFLAINVSVEVKEIIKIGDVILVIEIKQKYI